MNSPRQIRPQLNKKQRAMLNASEPERLTGTQVSKRAHLASTALTPPSGVKRSDTSSFPNQPVRGQAPPLTVSNLRYVLSKHGITVRFNVIKKEVEVLHPGHEGTVENALNVAEAKIISLVATYGMSTAHVDSFLLVLADENPFNPAETWIRSKPWDGIDRLPDFYETLQVEDGYDTSFRNVLMHKWLLSAAAAALVLTGFKTRGVLTLQGAQGIGKTS